MVLLTASFRSQAFSPAGRGVLRGLSIQWFASTQRVLSLSMGWTIFTAIDLFVGALLIDLLSTSVPPEKLPRLRKARNVILILFGVSVAILCLQMARRRGWI